MADMLVKHAGYKDREAVEIGVLCHFRAWREGRAEALTDTVEQLTGQQDSRCSSWLDDHLAEFRQAQHVRADRWVRDEAEVPRGCDDPLTACQAAQRVVSEGTCPPPGSANAASPSTTTRAPKYQLPATARDRARRSDGAPAGKRRSSSPMVL